MSTLRGDYIGFSYNGIHSSDLGIVRTSDGSRFNENLLPTMQDKVVQIPGGDGSYYFGSYYTQRQFNISFAFDSLTEQQLGFIKELFGDKKIHPLIFDEAPYKIYDAKVTGTNTIKYIPFKEGEVNRIYKGEGSIQFTCYQPFAICKNKDLAGYDLEQAKEWNNSANLLDFSKESLSSSLEENGTLSIEIYNPGSKDTDWELIFEFGEDNLIPGFIISIDNLADFKMATKEMQAKSSNGINQKDIGICFNSKTNLIEGLADISTDSGKIVYKKSGNIYNEYIQAGTFFKMPITIKKTATNVERIKKYFLIEPINSANIPNYNSLNYNYYYY